MEEQNQVTNQEQNNEDSSATEQNSTTVETPELKAALELVKESNATIAALNKEIADLKQANAKLAIQQSISAPARSAEDIINDMF